MILCEYKEGAVKVRAIYHEEVDHDSGRVTHTVAVDGGGFVVSSKEVGVAVQNFLHHAQMQDVRILANHLLTVYAEMFAEAERLEMEEDNPFVTDLT